MIRVPLRGPHVRACRISDLEFRALRCEFGLGVGRLSQRAVRGPTLEQLNSRILQPGNTQPEPETVNPEPCLDHEASLHVGLLLLLAQLRIKKLCK